MLDEVGLALGIGHSEGKHVRKSGVATFFKEADLSEITSCRCEPEMAIHEHRC